MNKSTFFIFTALALILSACTGLPESINPNWGTTPNNSPIVVNAEWDEELDGCVTVGTLFVDPAFAHCAPLVMIEKTKDGDSEIFRVMEGTMNVEEITEPLLVRFSYVPSDPALDETLEPNCLEYKGVSFTCFHVIPEGE